ncbi:MAG: monothiol glutaredoxin [Thermoproteota archaeon]|jgi:monothiol glutaredoxin
MTDGSPFNILNQPNYELAKEITSLNGTDLTDVLKNLTNNSQIVLFMKGNVSMPQCGFSANSSSILLSYEKSFSTFNILSNDEVRSGIKEFSNWPTFPQLYIKGQLVGGNDIIVEMHQNGDLKELISTLEE